MAALPRFDVLIAGMGPAGIAAACAAAESGLRVAAVDDNPREGGQIWRGESPRPASKQSAGWIARFRAARPDILITSDFIAGFPGETDADHQATLDLIGAVGYGMAYSFKYSPRPGTPAAERAEVPGAVADVRLHQIQALITRQQRVAQDAMVGREVSVLYEKAGRMPGQMVGKSDHLHAVHVDDSLGQPGDLVRVRISASSANSLAGVRIAG